MSSDDVILSDCIDGDSDCLLDDRKVRETLSGNRSAKILNYEKGENVFKAGKPIVGFYVVCEGVVKEVSCPTIGDKITLKVFKSGDVLAGDAFFFEEERHRTRAQAITGVKVLFIKKSVFSELLNVAPVKVSKELARNMRYLRKNLELASRPVLKKTAYWLAKIIPDSDNRLTISNKELAEIIGCSHVTVSKKLSKLAEADLIEKEGQDLTVPDRARLKKEAADRLLN